MEFEGYVQGSDIFAQAIVVEQDSSNPNRVNVLWPGVLINQLRIFALLAQFRLSTTQS
jgi:phage tail sheath gpL-like